MNILMLGWELPPHNSGGLGVACFEMSKALSKEGVAIDFVVPYSADHKDIDFMNIHSVSNRLPLYATDLHAYSTVTSKPELRDVQNEYINYVKAHVSNNIDKYDAIHVHDWLTLEAGVKAKEIIDCPLIAHVHATEFDRAGGSYGNPLIHEIERTGLQLADRIIAVSNATKQILIRNYSIPANMIDVVYNALSVKDVENYEYNKQTYTHLEQMKQDGYTVVTTITRFTIQKGLTYLLEAAAKACERYHKLIFLFAGDGEQRDELLSLSAELGIADKVYFTGFIRGKQWRDAYALTDIFVMSSVSEPFGITALEAAHYDNAIILTNQSGVGEVLKNVYRYDYWDINSLADRIITLANSKALQAVMKENLRLEYSQLDWSSVAKQCVNLYRSFKGNIQYV